MTAGALAFTACKTHTGPSEGLTIYEHPNFGGDSHTADADTWALSNLKGPCGEYYDPDRGIQRDGDWDDCVSSIQISPGWEAVVYQHAGYSGDSLVITDAIRDLDDVAGPCGGDWDDCISSIRVQRSP